eukprot:15362777-Ditylum_brightwellii.AAC.1
MKSTKVSTPDSSKNCVKLTNENKTKTLTVMCTVITPQTDKANTNQADINNTTTNKPSSLPSALHRTNSIKSHCLNSATAGAMIANDINYESASLQDEDTEVSSSCKCDSNQSSNKPLTTPTSKPAEPSARDELILMMKEMQSEMNQQFQDMHQRQFNCFTSCLTTLSFTVVSNKEFLQKIKSNLSNMTYTFSKFKYRLKKEEKIYIDQQKDIKQCITEVEMHVQNNAVINNKFE